MQASRTLTTMTIPRFFLLALPLAALAVACSAAPDDATESTTEALGRGGSWLPQPRPVWPLANPQYCPTVWPHCDVVRTEPTDPQFILYGCATQSVRIDYGNEHPYNGPNGMILGTYVLCPVGAVPAYDVVASPCNKCVPEAPPGQVWALTFEAVGPCQTGCWRDPAPTPKRPAGQ